MTKFEKKSDLKEFIERNCIECFYADQKAVKKFKPCCTYPGILTTDGDGNCENFEFK